MQVKYAGRVITNGRIDLVYHGEGIDATREELGIIIYGANATDVKALLDEHVAVIHGPNGPRGANTIPLGRNVVVEYTPQNQSIRVPSFGAIKTFAAERQTIEVRLETLNTLRTLLTAKKSDLAKAVTAREAVRTQESTAVFAAMIDFVEQFIKASTLNFLVDRLHTIAEAKGLTFDEYVDHIQASDNPQAAILGDINAFYTFNLGFTGPDAFAFIQQQITNSREQVELIDQIFDTRVVASEAFGFEVEQSIEQQIETAEQELIAEIDENIANIDRRLSERDFNNLFPAVEETQTNLEAARADVLVAQERLITLRQQLENYRGDEESTIFIQRLIAQEEGNLAFAQAAERFNNETLVLEIGSNATFHSAPEYLNRQRALLEEQRRLIVSGNQILRDSQTTTIIDFTGAPLTALEDTQAAFDFIAQRSAQIDTDIRRFETDIIPSGRLSERGITLVNQYIASLQVERAYLNDRLAPEVRTHRALQEAEANGQTPSQGLLSILEDQQATRDAEQAYLDERAVIIAALDEEGVDILEEGLRTEITTALEFDFNTTTGAAKNYFERSGQSLNNPDVSLLHNLARLSQVRAGKTDVQAGVQQARAAVAQVEAEINDLMITLKNDVADYNTRVWQARENALANLDVDAGRLDHRSVQANVTKQKFNDLLVEEFSGIFAIEDTLHVIYTDEASQRKYVVKTQFHQDQGRDEDAQMRLSRQANGFNGTQHHAVHVDDQTSILIGSAAGNAPGTFSRSALINRDMTLGQYKTLAVAAGLAEDTSIIETQPGQFDEDRVQAWILLSSLSGVSKDGKVRGAITGLFKQNFNNDRNQFAGLSGFVNREVVEDRVNVFVEGGVSRTRTEGQQVSNNIDPLTGQGALGVLGNEFAVADRANFQRLGVVFTPDWDTGRIRDLQFTTSVVRQETNSAITGGRTDIYPEVGAQAQVGRVAVALTQALGQDVTTARAAFNVKQVRLALAYQNHFGAESLQATASRKFGRVDLTAGYYKDTYGRDHAVAQLSIPVTNQSTVNVGTNGVSNEFWSC